MRILALIFGVSCAVMAAAPAEAFRYRTCDGVPLRLQGNNHTLHTSTNSFPAGYWQNGLINAINQFNHNPSNFWYSRVDDTSVGRGNGQSEVWGSTDQGALQGAPAIAYSYWQCYRNFWGTLVAHMTEGDVIFDYTNTAANPFEWTVTQTRTGLIWYGGGSRLLQATAVHEFGHATGLLHVNTIYNVMGSDFTHVHTNGKTTNAYLGEDAGNGTAFLYGNWGSGPLDVAVSHWRYSGASGEYSTHEKVRIWTTAGVQQPIQTIVGERGYRVRRGFVYRVEFTYENNGRAYVSGVPTRWVVSTNDIISTADTLIGTGSFNLARDAPLQWYVNLRIPASLAVNRAYWLGVILNPTGSSSYDGRSYNNYTYIPIWVTL
jgi:hypothetical protein